MMQNHNQQKKIALINDFTGFGRCSNCGTDADYFNAESAVLCSAYLDFFKSYRI